MSVAKYGNAVTVDDWDEWVNPETELWRVVAGPRVDQRPLGMTANVVATCAEDAEKVLARCTQVLGLVLRHARNDLADWPSDDAWTALLPAWFVDACAPSRREATEDRWHLSGWLYWFGEACGAGEVTY